jgi:hypothetical protein
MPFWSNPTLDPKRQFRFKVTFDGGGIKPPVYIAQSADRPTYTISAGTKVHFLDKEFKYPGKVSWQDVKMGFIDGIDTGNGSTGNENMASQAYKYLANAGFIYPSALTGNQDSPQNLKTISKKGSIINTIKIEPLRTEGSVIETYTLKNAFITSFTPSGFDYAQEGFSTLQLTIVYDWAEFSGPQ